MRPEGSFYAGSAFVTNFSFVSSFGKYYIPATVTYTYHAKNEDDDFDKSLMSYNRTGVYYG